MMLLESSSRGALPHGVLTESRGPARRLAQDEGSTVVRDATAQPGLSPTPAAVCCVT